MPISLRIPMRLSFSFLFLFSFIGLLKYLRQKFPVKPSTCPGMRRIFLKYRRSEQNGLTKNIVDTVSTLSLLPEKECAPSNRHPSYYLVLIIHFCFHCFFFFTADAFPDWFCRCSILFRKMQNKRIKSYV